MIKNFLKDLLILIIIFIVCGFLSLYLVAFPHFDWYNYKLYSGWALFNDRFDIDFLAANYRSYYNPYLQVPFYLFMKIFNNQYPNLLIFLASFDTAFLFFIIYKIFVFYFKEHKILLLPYITFSIFIVFFSPAMILERSFDFNDIQIAGIELLSFYVLIKNIFAKNNKYQIFFILLSGFILGIATGLKLTAVLYCITFSLGFLVLYKYIQNPFKMLFSFVLGIFLGFILVDGYWLYTIYSHFGNPLFPYFNNVIYSDFAEKISVLWQDVYFVKPKNLMEYVFYPFYMTSSEQTVFNGEDFYDIRCMFIYILVFIIAIYTYIQKVVKKETKIFKYIENNHLYLLLFVFALTYNLNILFLGSLRYIIATTSLFGIIFIVVVCELMKNIEKCKTIKNVLIVLTLFSLAGIIYSFSNAKEIEIIRLTEKDISIIEMKDFGIKDNSYVFLRPFSTSYIVPFQNKNAKYRMIGFEEIEGKTFSRYLVETNKKLINNSELNKYVAVNKIDPFVSYENIEKYINEYAEGSNVFELKNCQNSDTKIFNTDIEEQVMICEIKNK